MRSKTHRGSLSHRLLIIAFSAILTLLLIWSIDYLLFDIERMPGPDREQIEKIHVETELLDRSDQLRSERIQIDSEIKYQRDLQQILRNSTDHKRETSQNDEAYHENHRNFEEANRKIAELTKRGRELELEENSVDKSIDDQRQIAENDFQKQREKHNLKIAFFKLIFIVPLLIIATIFLIRNRESSYRSFIYAAFIATFWETGAVMRRYFPGEIFKYIVIGVSILVVGAVLRHLILLAISPKKDWLIKRNRESYKKWRCPVCACEIPKLERRSIQSYSCPSCGTDLYEKCNNCEDYRHSQLPFCRSCGSEKEVS